MECSLCSYLTDSNTWIRSDPCRHNYCDPCLVKFICNEWFKCPYCGKTSQVSYQPPQEKIYLDIFNEILEEQKTEQDIFLADQESSGLCSGDDASKMILEDKFSESSQKREIQFSQPIFKTRSFSSLKPVTKMNYRGSHSQSEKMRLKHTKQASRPTPILDRFSQIPNQLESLQDANNTETESFCAKKSKYEQESDKIEQKILEKFSSDDKIDFECPFCQTIYPDSSFVCQDCFRFNSKLHKAYHSLKNINTLEYFNPAMGGYWECPQCSSPSTNGMICRNCYAIRPKNSEWVPQCPRCKTPIFSKSLAELCDSCFLNSDLR